MLKEGSLFLCFAMLKWVHVANTVKLFHAAMVLLNLTEHTVVLNEFLWLKNAVAQIVLTFQTTIWELFGYFMILKN